MNSQSPDTLKILIRSLEFQRYAEAFESETGLLVVLADLNGHCLNVHRPPRRPSLASVIYTSPLSSAITPPKNAIAQPELRELVQTSPMGEALAPICRGSELLGYLVTGGAFLRKPNDGARARILRALQEIDPALPPRARAELVRKTPVISQERLRAIAVLLQLFAEHLSANASRVLHLVCDIEPPSMKRAREFVAENHKQPLKLKQVAKVANMSLYHFCKTFKRVTGLTFTKYVCSVRVERAKELLLNPATKVIDVAFDSGFQSLSHFNRVFRALAGESPSSFRSSQIFARASALAGEFGHGGKSCERRLVA